MVAFISTSVFAVIEHLPQELRDRFTEIREMDLQVQSTAILGVFSMVVKWQLHSFCPDAADTTDSLEDRIRTLFSNAKKMKVPERDAEYELIRKDYFKVLDDAGKILLQGKLTDLSHMWSF